MSTTRSRGPVGADSNVTADCSDEMFGKITSYEPLLCTAGDDDNYAMGM